MIPRKLSLQTFLFRLFASMAGSLMGTIVLFFVFFITSTVNPTEETNVTLSLYVVLAIMLLGTISTNVITPFFISLTDKERYQRPMTILTQTFILNLVLFMVSVPLYALLAQLEPTKLNYLAAFHFLLTVQMSALLTEMFSKSHFIVTGIYGVALGGLVSFTTIAFLFFSEKQTFILFLIAPLLWVSIECFRSLTEVLYYYYYSLFGIEALDADTSYEAPEKEDN